MSIVLYRIVKFIARRRQHQAATLLCVLCSWAFLSTATAQDTIQVLKEVEVSSQRTPATLRTVAPTQVLDASAIEEQGLLQLSDAVRQMAGVTLKDYGGVGGMKTVSARGLGSQFSTVTIDGIAISDAQNGQVDLGRYLLGNAAYVSFSQGQQQEPLLSARAYAAGNVLNLETEVPTFFLAERTNLKVGIELGSFNMMSPTLLWERKWNKKLKSSLWANYLTSDGDYPFTLYYTASHSDSSSHERRLHSAMRMFTADGNLFYTLGEGNLLTAKLHCMTGFHQLPGPVQYYNQWISKQSTHEEVAFAQVKWRRERGAWKTQLLGKLQRSYDRYEDSAATTLTGYLMNDYLQHEGYVSGSAVWSPTAWLDLKGATDGSLAALRTNLAQRNDVQRDNVTAVAALRLHRSDKSLNGIEVNTHLLGTAIRDHVADLDTLPTYRRLSPYVGVSLTLRGHTTLRWFYKETFRAPNFSELYFFSLPRDLRPERARQHNIGITHGNRWMNVTVDAYRNRVTDKILAIPTQNMFLWSMQNLGKAEITGVDVTANCQLSAVSCQLNYSYQRALDRTDPDGRTYGHQIAYTPLHSGGGSVRWESPWVNLGATALVVGERYYRMQNTADALMPAYWDLGLSADRRFSLRWGTLLAQVQVLNLLDVQYEVVRSYPMMGRNYRLKIIYEF
ncbi:MAG: TonB-dependent receptor [Bacteroidales bacterium]|nr:TonB-dependent receptor [Bacteroidales bacterium]